mmetsp:Transcript_13241/g.27286  ORF Transcript_13241/g.27286 Transcript_13241/m.27286 type:complete len:277 (-) Transcript_13241:8-838(-)
MQKLYSVVLEVLRGVFSTPDRRHGLGINEAGELVGLDEVDLLLGVGVQPGADDWPCHREECRRRKKQGCPHSLGVEVSEHVDDPLGRRVVDIAHRHGPQIKDDEQLLLLRIGSALEHLLCGLENVNPKPRELVLALSCRVVPPDMDHADGAPLLVLVFEDVAFACCDLLTDACSFDRDLPDRVIQTVRVGSAPFDVFADSWSSYFGILLVQTSEKSPHGCFAWDLQSRAISSGAPPPASKARVYCGDLSFRAIATACFRILFALILGFLTHLPASP